MCFSAKASFIAAAGLSVVGIATVAQARDKKILPFAASPLFFGLQQALEGLVWLTMNAPGASMSLRLIGIYGFTFFAGTFWPIWIPWALYLPERNRHRRNLLRALVGIGTLLGFGVLVSNVLLGVGAEAVDHHIAYYFLKSSPLQPSSLVIFSLIWWFLYTLPTVASFFISTLPYAWVPGLLITAAFIGAQISYHVAFGSVWCYFAAVISLVAYGVVYSYQRSAY